MATTIQRIEKEFFLKVLYDEQTPIVCLRSRREYTLIMDKPAGTGLSLKAERHIPGLYPRKKLRLMAYLGGTALTFSVEIISVKHGPEYIHILAKPPQYLYKNLERAYARIPGPSNLQLHVSYTGERYVLDYPKTAEFQAPDAISQAMLRMNPQNFTGLVAQIGAWIKGFAAGYKLILFSDAKPASIEERLLAQTGKTLYLPAAREGEFPQADPFPQGRIITEDAFRRFLENAGTEPDELDGAVSRFLQDKADAGIRAEAYVPILFYEYAAGYLYVWCGDEEKRPFDYEVLSILFEFAAALAFSLKENGYFEGGHLDGKPLKGNIVDISVSGLLFTSPLGAWTSMLEPGDELSVKLTTPGRTIECGAVIARRYWDRLLTCFGCRFTGMNPADLRFLFEFLYGRPFTGGDAAFIAGQV
jgi:hypothetical protein